MSTPVYRGGDVRHLLNGDNETEEGEGEKKEQFPYFFFFFACILNTMQGNIVSELFAHWVITLLTG